LADAGTIDVRPARWWWVPARLARDLDLVCVPEHWTEARLAAWLCRNLRETYITQSSMMLFVSEFLSGLLKVEGMDLARANRQKFLLRALLEAKIRELRRQAVTTAYQQFLFTDGVGERALVGADFEFEFHPDGYAPSEDYGRASEFLAVEYKGAHRWAEAESDRKIGALWEELSGGRCRFVMVKEKRWEWIIAKL
jgi:hypothetical protein